MINPQQRIRIVRKSCTCLLFVPLILFGVATMLSAASKVISFEDPRPLSELAHRLELEYGWRITYEEAPRTSSDDLVNSSRVGTFLVPRSIPLLVSFPEPTHKRSNDETAWIEEKRRNLDDLLAQSPVPMRLIHNGDYSHLVPIQIRKKTGEIVGFVPMLDTLVSFAPAKRSLLETVILILSQVSKARGIPIAIGGIPNNFFIQQQLLTDADNESARDVLMRIFEGANGSQRLAGGPEARVTWALLYDANPNEYFFNAHIIAPVKEPQDTYIRKSAVDTQK